MGGDEEGDGVGVGGEGDGVGVGGEGVVWVTCHCCFNHGSIMIKLFSKLTAYLDTNVNRLTKFFLLDRRRQ